MGETKTKSVLSPHHCWLRGVALEETGLATAAPPLHILVRGLWPANETLPVSLPLTWG